MQKEVIITLYNENSHEPIDEKIVSIPKWSDDCKEQEIVDEAKEIMSQKHDIFAVNKGLGLDNPEYCKREDVARSKYNSGPNYYFIVEDYIDSDRQYEDYCCDKMDRLDQEKSGWSSKE